MTKAKNEFIKTIKESNINGQILDSFDEIERMEYFDPAFKKKIYDCDKLPIGNGQRSDDPISLAKMINLLKPKKTWKLLEVGTGSGYSTAVLSQLVSEIYTIDYYEDLAHDAKVRLLNEGHENIRFFAGDASDLNENPGPFDGIIILSACTLSPYSILDMLKSDGRAVFVMGPSHQQQIVSFENSDIIDISAKNFKYHDFCTFESIKGKYGWIDQDDSYITDEAKV